MKTEETWVLVAMEVKGRCRELDDMSGLACCGFSPAQRETIPATVVAGDGGLCYCFFFLFFFFYESQLYRGHWRCYTFSTVCTFTIIILGGLAGKRKRGAFLNFTVYLYLDLEP
ncbi:hypothetical protein LI328DRAFT_67946 [Trichoderma asperelloides]|nr:hypothetical protein LI328DRAFT_67946 [Trichoderma asperelloides]